MVILSVSSSSTLLALQARVSSSLYSTSSSAATPALCFLSLRSSTVVRRRPKFVLFCTSKMARGVVELVEDKEATASTSSELCHSRTFLDARSGEDLLSGIQREKEAGRLPLNVAWGMEELYHNYRDAVFQSGDPNADEIVLSNMSVALDRIFMVVKDPFVFSPYHMAIREPFDYYLFSQKYIRPLIDFRNSYVGNLSLFSDMEKKLRQGDNVILISNHQTEADPAVIALLLESTNPDIGEAMTYVAGDRVVTDPLCKPFSMGRNLLCVFSKKHMNDDPELVEMKQRANTRSLKDMALLLRSGSKIIWIAPSGGRDRLTLTLKNGFVDNMRRLVEHAGVPGHIYPLALLCHDIMPPPAQVEKEIGERRVIAFHGTGLSIAPPINFHEITAACGDPKEAKVAYSQILYDSVHLQYDVLKSAIYGKQGQEASIPTVTLSQPWR